MSYKLSSVELLFHTEVEDVLSWVSQVGMLPL